MEANEIPKRLMWDTPASWDGPQEAGGEREREVQEALAVIRRAREENDLLALKARLAAS